MNIYVSKLNFRTTGESLQALFAQYGEVSSANIITDRETGRSRGFGFVEMPDEGQGQSAIDALNGTVQENLVGIRVVKAFVRAGYEKTKFKKSNDDLTKAAINVDMRVIAMMPIMMIALNGATAAVLYLGGSTVMSGGMLIGDLSSFITYIFQILMSVMMLGMSLLRHCLRPPDRRGAGDRALH